MIAIESKWRFWALTSHSVKESVRLYFDPVRWLAGWIVEQVKKTENSFRYGDQSAYRFTILSQVLVIPALVAFVIVCFGVSWIVGIIATGLLGFLIILPFLLRYALEFLARLRLKPKEELFRESAQYSELIQIHCRMLSMTSKELAFRAGLFGWEAKFLMQNPRFIPRQDVKERVLRALMLPKTWPASGYGDEYVKERLLWYAFKGQQVLSTANQVDNTTAETRAKALEVLERGLREGLAIGRNKNNILSLTEFKLAFIAVAFGVIIAVLGVILIYLGNAGATTLSLLGQKVNTSSVGIAAIALSCFVVITSLTKIIGVMGRMMDHILRREDLFENPEVLPGSEAGHTEAPQ